MGEWANLGRSNKWSSNATPDKAVQKIFVTSESNRHRSSYMHAEQGTCIHVLYIHVHGDNLRLSLSSFADGGIHSSSSSTVSDKGDANIVETPWKFDPGTFPSSLS